MAIHREYIKVKVPKWTLSRVFKNKHFHQLMNNMKYSPVAITNTASRIPVSSLCLCVLLCQLMLVVEIIWTDTHISLINQTANVGLCLIMLVLLEAGSYSEYTLYCLIRFYSSPKHGEVVSTCTVYPLAPVKLLPDSLFLFFVITKEKSSKQAGSGHKLDKSNFRACQHADLPETPLQTTMGIKSAENEG